MGDSPPGPGDPPPLLLEPPVPKPVHLAATSKEGGGPAGRPKIMRSFAQILAEEKENRNILEIKLTKCTVIIDGKEKLAQLESCFLMCLSSKQKIVLGWPCSPAGMTQRKSSWRMVWILSPTLLFQTNLELLELLDFIVTRETWYLVSTYCLFGSFVCLSNPSKTANNRNFPQYFFHSLQDN